MGKKKNKLNMANEGGIPSELFLDPVALDAYLLAQTGGTPNNGYQKVVSPPSTPTPKYNPISDGNYSKKKQGKPSISSTIGRILESSASKNDTGNSNVSKIVQPVAVPANNNVQQDSKQSTKDVNEFAALGYNLYSMVENVRIPYGPCLQLFRVPNSDLLYPISVSPDLPEFMRDDAFSIDDIYSIINSFYTINKLMSLPDAVYDTATNKPANIADEIGFCDNDQIVAFVNPEFKSIIQLYIIDVDYVYKTFAPDFVDKIHEVGGNVVATIIHAIANKYPSPFWVEGNSPYEANAEIMAANFIDIINKPCFQNLTETEAQDLSEFVQEPSTFFELVISSINLIVSASFEKFNNNPDDSESSDDDYNDYDEERSIFEPFTSDGNSTEIGGVQDDNTPFLGESSESNTGGINSDHGSTPEKSVNGLDSINDSKGGTESGGFGTSLGPIIRGLDIKQPESNVSPRIGEPSKFEEKEKEGQEEREERSSGVNGSGGNVARKEEIGKKEDDPNGQDLVIPVTIVGMRK